MVVIMEIFLGINAGRGKNEARAEVNSNLRFAVDKIESDLRGATAVSAPVSTGASSSVLTITNASGTITYCVASSTLWRAAYNLGGVSTWQNTTALPQALRYGAGATYNGYLYSLGGTGISSVYFSSINATGLLSAWSSTRALPNTLMAHAVVTNNGYVYIIGGQTTFGDANITSTVLYAPINATGSLGVWSTTTALPTSTTFNTFDDAVASNGYVYVIGGYTGNPSAATSTVWYAPINATGSLGAWSATTQLPGAYTLNSDVINNGYVYVIGGGIPTVYYVPVNATGSLGTWSTTTALPNSLSYHSALIYNGYIYVTGGDPGTGVTSTVLYAPINATGSLGAWSATVPLLTGRDAHSAIPYNGYVYIIGGTADVVTSTVSYAPFACTGDAITASTVLVNSAIFTRFENINTLLNKTVVSVQADIVVSYNGTAPEDQYSEEKITTTGLRN